jgi:hypothetical protein
VERLLDGAALKGLLEPLSGDPFLQASVDGGTLRGVEKVPALGLGLPSEFIRLVEGRMNLHGEAIAGIEELDQQGEAGGGVLQMAGTKNLLPMAVPEFMELLSLKGTRPNDALSLGAVDHFPEFPDGGSGGKGLAQKGFKPASSPDAFHGQWFKGERGGEIHGKGG